MKPTTYSLPLASEVSRHGVCFRLVAGLVLFTQFWFPILSQAQTTPPIVFPEEPIPTAPNYQRTNPVPTPNYPARPTPGTTPVYKPGGINPGSTPTQNVVPTANDAQSLINNTLVPSQKPPTVLHPMVTGAPGGTPAPSELYGTSSGGSATGGGQVNIRELFPGGTGDTILYDTLNGSPSLIKGAAQQAKANLAQIGCRTTHFSAMTNPAGLLGPTEVLYVVTERVTLVPVTGSNPVTYTQQIDAQAENYTGPVDIDVPLLGYKSIKYVTIREATPSVPGLRLHYEFYPFNAPADGTFFPFDHVVGGALSGSINSYGTLDDHFTIRAAVTMNGTFGYLFSTLYAVQRSFTGTVPTGPCAPDPPGCVLDGVDTCSPPAAGVQALFNVTKSSPMKAMDSLNTSVFKPHPLTADPDLQTVLGSNASMQNESNPVYNELFAGCTISSEDGTTGSSTYHKPDIYHCQNMMKQAFNPNGCDGDRLFTFALQEASHVILQVDVQTVTPWPRPAPTCLSPSDTLSGGWTDPMTGTNTWMCNKPPIPPTCNAGYTLEGTGPADWQCVDPGSPQTLVPPSYSPVIPTQPTPYAPTISSWSPTVTPSTYTGPITHGIPLINGGGTYTEGPLADGKKYVYTILPLAQQADTVFPWNITVVPTGGTVSNLNVSTAGEAADNWSIALTADVAGVSSWQVRADVYLVTANKIVGCENYMAMLADRFCTGKMDCLVDRGLPGPTMDVSPSPPSQFVVNADGTGTYGGIAKLLKPWGPPDSAYNNNTSGNGPIKPVPNSCWKAHGNPMTCSFGTGDIPCYIDAQGHQVCGGSEACTTDPVTNIQTCDANLVSHFGDPDFLDNCGVRSGPASGPNAGTLWGNPGCVNINGPKTVCAPSGLGIYSHVCYVFDVAYDCGTNETITVPVGTTPPTIQSCGGPIRCLGTECHNPKPEANPDFNTAAVATAVADGMQHDLNCLGGDPISVDANGNLPAGCELRIFPGTWMWCKQPIGRQIGLTPDCCKESDAAAGGTDVLSYIQLAMAVSKLSNLPWVQNALAAIPGYSGLIQDFTTMASEIKGAANSTLSMLQGGFNSISSSLGVASDSLQAAEAATDFADLASGVGALLDGFQQMIYQALQELITQVAGEEVAQMFVTGGTIATSSVENAATGETYSCVATIADYGPGVILEALNTVMLVYTVLKIIGQIVFKCEAQELQLGIQRKVGNCHSVGGYCKVKVLGVTCADWRNAYCCYKTPLARIINEQIRKQFSSGNDNFGYGPADNPRCDGLSVAEMSTANWAAIDLSEWLQIMQDTGLVAKSAPDATSKYGVDARSNFTVLPLKPVASPTGFDDQVTTARMTSDLGPKTQQIGQRRMDLAKQPVCYKDPAHLPWYEGQLPPPGDVIRQVGGTGQLTSCGTGCIEITLGKDQYHAYCGTGTVVNQNYAIDVLLPELIQSASITEATWDDHLQINIAGNAIYTSPSFYAGGDLNKTWCLTQATVSPGGGCAYPSGVPAGGLPPPGIDVTSIFQGGGLINTDTIAKVWGCGHGYAKLQVHYGQPATAEPGTDCIVPPAGAGSSTGITCSMSASPSSPIIGQPVFLTTTCGPGSPTSHTWSASAGCTTPSGAGASATVSEPTVKTCSYTDIASDGTNTASASITLIYGNGLPPPPTCSVASSLMTPVIGVDAPLLNATCSGSPSSFTWTNCSSAGASCSPATPGAPGAVTYSVTATNAYGTSAPAQVTVNWVANGPPVCTLTPSVANPVPGQTVDIQANCVGPGPIAYTWGYGCDSLVNGGSACRASSQTAPGTRTITVYGTNASGAGPLATLVVTWANGAPTGSDFCGSYSDVMEHAIVWGTNGDNSNDINPIHTSRLGGFRPSTIWVVPFAIPGTATGPWPVTALGNGGAAEYQGPPTIRQTTLSASKCDFRPVDPTGVNGPFASQEGTSTLIIFSTNTVMTGTPNLLPGQTYYLNTRNWSSSIGATCSTPTCDASFQLNWPR